MIVPIIAVVILLAGGWLFLYNALTWSVSQREDLEGGPDGN